MTILLLTSIYNIYATAQHTSFLSNRRTQTVDPKPQMYSQFSVICQFHFILDIFHIYFSPPHTKIYVLCINSQPHHYRSHAYRNTLHQCSSKINRMIKIISVVKWQILQKFLIENNSSSNSHTKNLEPCHPTFILISDCFFPDASHPTSNNTPVTSYRKSFKPQITHVTPLLILIYSKTQVTQHAMFTSFCLTIIPRMSTFALMILTYLLSTLTCSSPLFPCMDIWQRTLPWCLMKTISL